MSPPLLFMAALALTAGTVARNFLPLPPWVPVGGAYVLLNLCALFQRQGRMVVLIPILFLMIGLIPEAVPEIKPSEIQMDPVSGVEGKILNTPRRDRRGRWFFDLKTERFEMQTEKGVKRLPGVQVLRVKGLLFHERLCRGASLSVSGHLREASPASHPGGFDERDYLKRSGIFRVFEVLPGSPPRLHDRGTCWIQACRERIDQSLGRFFEGAQLALARALVTGNRSGMPSEMRLRFARTGTAHLLAISGLHLALFATGLYAILLALRLRPRKACVISAAFVIFYAALSGLRIPVLRAAVMTLALLAAKAFKRSYSVREAYCLSMILFIGFQPTQISQISFLLSFISVGVLIFVLPAWVDRWAWYEGIRITIVITAAILPLLAKYFSIVSPVSPLANLMAVPLMTAVLFPLLLMIPLGPLPVLPDILSLWVSFCFRLLNDWLEWLTRLPGAFIHVSSPGNKEVFLYYLLLLFMIGIFRSSCLKRIRIVLLMLWIGVWTGLWAGGKNQQAWGLTVFPNGRLMSAHLRLSGGHDWIFSDAADKGLRRYLEREAVNDLSGWVTFSRDRSPETGYRPVSGNWHYLIYPHTESRKDPGKLSRMMRESMHIGHQQGGSMAVRDADGQLIVLTRHRNCLFIFVPRMTPKGVRMLQSEPLLTKHDGPAIVFFTKTVSIRDERVTDLLTSINPSLIVVAGLRGDFAEGNIPVLFLREGALRFQEGLHSISVKRYNGTSYEPLSDLFLEPAFV